MGLATAFVIFTVLVVVLSALRRRLVFELSALSLLLFGSSRPGVLLYSLLVLPGTVIHELSHWLVAEILQVRTGDIEILPELKEQGGEQRLGHVMTAHADPFRSFLIGAAPFVTGVGLLVATGYLLSRLWAVQAPWWQLALAGYGAMVLGNSMLISASDRRSWPIVILLVCGLSFALYYAGVRVSLSQDTALISALNVINIALGMTLGLNLGMIALSFAARRSAEHLTHKKVTQKGRAI